MNGTGTGAAPPGFDVGGFDMGALARSRAQAGESAMQAQAGRMMAEATRAMPGMGGDAPAFAAPTFAAPTFAAPAFAAPTFAALAPDTAELRRESRAPKRQGRPATAAVFLQEHDGAGQAKGGPPA